MKNTGFSLQIIGAFCAVAGVALAPRAVFGGETFTLKAYYPAPVITADYAVSSTLDFFDKEGVKKLRLYTPEGVSAPLVESETGDLNIAAASGYIYLAPSGRGVSVGGGIRNWCEYKPLSTGNVPTLCSEDKPYAFAVADLSGDITYDHFDLADGGYLLCCAAGALKAAGTYSGNLPSVAQPPSSFLSCVPRPPDVRTTECSEGQRGALAQIRFYTCPAQTPGDWLTIGGACISAPIPNPCVPPSPETQVLECPYPQSRKVSGWIYQTKTWSCDGPLPVSSGWVTTKNTCGQECAHDMQGRSSHPNHCCSGISQCGNDLAGCSGTCKGEVPAG